jgi:hypothetical protein
MHSDLRSPARTELSSIEGPTSVLLRHQHFRINKQPRVDSLIGVDVLVSSSRQAQSHKIVGRLAKQVGSHPTPEVIPWQDHEKEQRATRQSVCGLVWVSLMCIDALAGRAMGDHALWCCPDTHACIHHAASTIEQLQ